jgi:hypothetical protein
MGEVLYLNCGDWVESCTALLERADGTLELMQWRDHAVRLKRHSSNPQGDLWEDVAA